MCCTFQQMEIPTNSNNPTAERNPVDMLKWICLSRQCLKKIEQAHDDEFGAMRKLLLGCLVRVNVQGEYLVGFFDILKNRLK